MEETTYLKQKIKDCRRKLNLAKILENCVYYISFGALAAVLVEGISLFVPFYYANYFAAGCIGIGCLTGLVRTFLTWADMKVAAKKLDSFGLQERTMTAYENLDKEDAFTKMQRNDAVQMLKENESNIRISIKPNTRHLFAFVFSLACVCTLALVPSVAKEQAKEQHALKQEVKEKKKELSSVMDALEDIDTKSLSAEEKKKLQELIIMYEKIQILAKKNSSSKVLKILRKIDKYTKEIERNKLDQLIRSTLSYAEWIVRSESLAKTDDIEKELEQIVKQGVKLARLKIESVDLLDECANELIEDIKEKYTDLYTKSQVI